MRSLICQFVVLSLLFMGFEGATDVIPDGTSHGDEVAHESEFGHSLNEHDGSVPDSELDGEHCAHCCHGHSSAVQSLLSSLTTPITAGDRRADPKSHLRNLAQAPPTPPPNA